MFWKFMVFGFVVFMIILGLALVKVSGYWSRVEEERDRLEFMSKENNSDNED